MKPISYILVLVFLTGTIHAQSLINGDLEGDATTIGNLPNQWQVVPHTDPDCLANKEETATPDVTSMEGPGANIGLFGIPFSGETFLSGLLLSFQDVIWHEGIQQTVNGFSPDSSYSIQFFQTVVKQNNAIDQSGSWAVYMDGQLVGISTPTFSTLSYSSKDLMWEFKSMDFVATAPSHTFKFLPFDDDPNTEMSETNASGGLRMGIDRIVINRNYPCDFEFSLGNDTTLCEGRSLVLGNLFPDAWYIWDDFSNENTFEVTRPGDYSVEIIKDGCSNRDTIQVEFEDCSGDVIMPNVFTPNGDGHNDLFQPMELFRIQSLTTRIFTRWGIQVHSSETLTIDWDGTMRNGNQAQPGVYFWILEFKDEMGNTGTRKGNVTLLR